MQIGHKTIFVDLLKIFFICEKDEKYGFAERSFVFVWHP